MAVFIELTTDAFAENLADAASSKNKGARSGRAGRRIVRRPTRGIEIKDDTYAILKVIDAAGDPIPLVDASRPDGSTITGYSNFLLQSVREQRMEKTQIVETFGDSYVFFFGEAPRFVDVQAVLLNTHDFNWRAEWWQNYNDAMRGTRLVETGARIYLFYDDIILEGYLMSSGVTETSQQPYHMTLNFKMFITNYSNISLVGNPNFPIRSSVQLPQDVNLTDGDAGLRLISRYRDGGWDSESIDAFDNKASQSKKAGEGGSGTTTTQNPDGSTTRTTSNQSGPFTTTTSSTTGGPGGGTTETATFGTTPPSNSVNPLARRVSDALRQIPRSFAVSQDVWTFLFSNPDATKELKDLVVRAGEPIRGLIADNWDEFVGLSEARIRKQIFGLSKKGDIPSAVQGTARSIQEVDDLWREAIQFLSCFGADIDNADSLISLGLGPNFRPKVSIGGGSAEGGVSFNPFSDAGQRRAEDYFDDRSASIDTGFGQFADDPLGNVFGRPRGSTNDQSLQNRPKYTEGAGDPLYGYPSDFAGGQPGFGVPGFGDFGGKGFGSALGEHGDPGFKDPNKFTFAGTADEKGAFDRFTTPKEDPTAITVGVGAGLSLGTGGISGGAGVAVNGRPAAFALVSVPGLLSPEGEARQQAKAIAEKQALQKFGFATDNPFGVKCPKPGNGPLEYSDSFTLP